MTNTAAGPFTIFHNIEMVEYCVPVPAGYKEKDDAGLQKGAHIFIDGGKKENRLYVQGLIRSDTSLSLLEYYNNTYPGSAAEEGRIIQSKQVLPVINNFYAKGYWSNLYGISGFLEITWLRAEELVTYKITMEVKDTSFWYRHLDEIINSKALCL